MSYVDVLLVEDDRVLGGALRQRLQLEGLSVTWVENCNQAVETFAEHGCGPRSCLPTYGCRTDRAKICTAV